MPKTHYTLQHSVGVEVLKHYRGRGGGGQQHSVVVTDDVGRGLVVVVLYCTRNQLQYDIVRPSKGGEERGTSMYCKFGVCVASCCLVFAELSFPP